MILVLEVVFASIAAILSLLSLRTLRAISHLGVGKSFWIPVFMSGVFFLIGSITTILQNMNFSLTTWTDEIVQISRLIALCTFLFGIYSYSRKVNESLTEKVFNEEKIVRKDLERDLEIEVPVEEDTETKAPIQERPIQERRIQKSLKTETDQECKHHFGYLRTLPRDAPIPEECLACARIIECKHSLVDTLETTARGQ